MENLTRRAVDDDRAGDRVRGPARRSSQKAPLRFTFKWPDDNQWQGSDFVVQVMHTADAKDDSALKRSAGS